MAQGNNNNLLIGLALLERLESQLKPDSREQLTKESLNLVLRTIEQALEKINNVELRNSTIILGNLISIGDLIKELTSDDDFVQTDVVTKDIICEKYAEALDDLYVQTGDYYTTRDFDYNLRLEPILVRVIKRCVRGGNYFGKA